jgi:hypothetical protein
MEGSAGFAEANEGTLLSPWNQSQLVRPAGLEPTTLCLEGRCSIQLSYERDWANTMPAFD